MRNGIIRVLLAYVLASGGLVLLCSPIRAEVADTLWESACAKATSNDIDGAKDILTRIVSNYPQSRRAPSALLKLAYITVRTNTQSELAITDAFTQVRTKYPNSPEAVEALARIGFLESRHDTVKAIGDFESFLSQAPSHSLAPDVRQSLARLYLRKGDLDRAEAAFDAVRGTPGASPSVVDEAQLQSGFVKIVRYYRTGDRSQLQTAMASLGRSHSSGSLKVRARADLGTAEAMLLLGQVKQARRAYQAAANTYTSAPYFRGMALYGVGVCSQYLADPAGALTAYSTLLNEQPGSILPEKDAAWKARALASTSSSVQVSIRQGGSWERLPGSSIVGRAACARCDCLYALGRLPEARQGLSDILVAFPQGDIADAAGKALKRCNMARGGK